MKKPILYKITYDEYVGLINDPMRKVLFHYENTTLVPSHIKFKTENEMNWFLLNWEPHKYPKSLTTMQQVGRAIRDRDVNSLYAHTMSPINIDKEN